MNDPKIKKLKAMFTAFHVGIKESTENCYEGINLSGGIATKI